METSELRFKEVFVFPTAGFRTVLLQEQAGPK